MNFRFFVFVVCGGKKMKKGLLVLLVVAFVAIVCGERSFTIEGDNFMKDGKPFQVFFLFLFQFQFSSSLIFSL